MSGLNEDEGGIDDDSVGASQLPMQEMADSSLQSTSRFSRLSQAAMPKPQPGQLSVF